MRGAPLSGFSVPICRMRARISPPISGRPPGRRAFSVYRHGICRLVRRADAAARLNVRADAASAARGSNAARGSATRCSSIWPAPNVTPFISPVGRSDPVTFNRPTSWGSLHSPPQLCQLPRPGGLANGGTCKYGTNCRPLERDRLASIIVKWPRPILSRGCGTCN